MVCHFCDSSASSDLMLYRIHGECDKQVNDMLRKYKLSPLRPFFAVSGLSGLNPAEIWQYSTLGSEYWKILPLDLYERMFYIGCRTCTGRARNDGEP